MTMMDAKRHTDTLSGVSNVGFDLLTILENKLKGLAAIEEYKIDCDDSGDIEAREVIEEIQRRDVENVTRLRDLIRTRI
jgi:hypothetical protein